MGRAVGGVAVVGGLGAGVVKRPVRVGTQQSEMTNPKRGIGGPKIENAGRGPGAAADFKRVAERVRAVLRSALVASGGGVWAFRFAGPQKRTVGGRAARPPFSAA